MDPKQQDYIKGLYARFYNESQDGNPSSDTYTEEELLDIFDYAGDLGDDYTQLMVLLKAHSDYPDDEDMAVRKGIFTTFNTGGNQQAQTFLDRHVHESALWDIMRIFNLKGDSASIGRALDKLLARFDELDDETVIRLIDLVAELDQYDWLMDNLGILKSKVMYVETLLNEVAQECIDRDDTGRAITLLTELTAIEPFDPVYWRMLAQQYVNSDNYDEALKAVDYAIAIDAKDLPTQLLKAQIEFDLHPDHGDAVARMERLYRKNPEDQSVAFFLAQMLTLTGRVDESRRVVEKFLKADPLDAQMIQAALLIHDDELSLKVLAAYLDNSKDMTDTHVEQYSNHLADVKCVRESVLLQLLWYRRNPATILVNRLIFGLYLYGYYQDIVDVLINVYGGSPVVDLSVMGPTEWTMGILASARVNNRDVAMSLITSLLSIDMSIVNPGVRLALTSSVAIAATLSTMFDANPNGLDAKDLLSIDPFVAGFQDM